VDHDAKSYLKHTLTYIPDHPNTILQASKQGTHFIASNTYIVFKEHHPSSTRGTPTYLLIDSAATLKAEKYTIYGS